MNIFNHFHNLQTRSTDDTNIFQRRIVKVVFAFEVNNVRHQEKSYFELGPVHAMTKLQDLGCFVIKHLLNWYNESRLLFNST